MVLSGKFADPGPLTTSPFKIRLKWNPMDSGGTKTAMVRSRGSSVMTIPRAFTADGDVDEHLLIPAVRRNTHQKARRILEDEEGTGESGLRGLRAKGTVRNYNYTIVASKGELARRYVPLEGEEERSGRRVPREDPRDNASRKLRAIIRKSASVPAVLKEGLAPARKEARRPSEEGILRRSSAFLASLAHATRITERKSPDYSLRTIKPTYASNGYRYSTLKGYLSVLTGVNDELPGLARSPSVQTLPVTGKKKSGTSVKKSVSFSSDTSFEEKRAPFRRPAVHEAKVYRKGVLQDRSSYGETIDTKVPPSWETPSGGQSALLRAARDAEDAILAEVVTRVRKLGLDDMDVNLTDSSGRTAVSYMAGNGASAMLELVLSFETVDPNIPDNEGNTPLHFAAQAGQTECLNIFLQRCPDIEVDARNASGFTPLMKAALQGRTKCAKILLFAGANPTLRDHGRGLRAEQWARFCGRYVCAEVIERFARHRLLERSTSCRWGSEPELAAKVLQGKVMPIPASTLSTTSTGLKSKIRRVFRTTSGPDRNFSLVSQLTSAALCASSPALPKSGDVPPVVKSLLRPLSVPQLRVTLVSPQDFLEKTSERYVLTEKIETANSKPRRTKKKNK